MLSIQSLKHPVFKADNNKSSIYDYNYYPQAQSIPQDVYIPQSPKPQTSNWQKAGVIFQGALAAAFIALAAGRFIPTKFEKLQVQRLEQELKPTGLKEKAVSIFEDLKEAIGLDNMALSDDMKDLVKSFKNRVKNNEIIAMQGGGNISPSLLLYGPPGTGKTTFAKAIAKEFEGSKFVSLDVTKMKDKYVGETEKNINALIDAICKEADEKLASYNEKLGEVIGKDIVEKGDQIEIAKAIDKAKKEGKKLPVMERIFVFADEIDSVMMVDTGNGAKFSNDVLNEFKKGFTEKLGKRKNITTMGATNLEIDEVKAIAGDGKRLDKPMLDRFSSKIRVPNPTPQQIHRKFLNSYKGMPNVADELKNGSNALNALSNELGKEHHNTSFRTINSIIETTAETIKYDDKGNLLKIDIDDILNTLEKMKEDMNISTEEMQQLREKVLNSRTKKS